MSTGRSLMSHLGADTKQRGNRVELLGSTVHVDDLEVPLNEAAEYLRGIPTEKRELAFVHAVQVGMAEIMARRRRFGKNGHSAFTLVAGPAVDAGKPTGADSSKSYGPEEKSVKEATQIETQVSVGVSTPRETAAEHSRHDAEERRTPASAELASVAQQSTDDTPIQPRISPPLEPTVEIAAERSSEKHVIATPPQEPDGWLRRLDEDFEILDKLQALDASRTGR